VSKQSTIRHIVLPTAKIRFLDSHSEGNPTELLSRENVTLGWGSLAERLEVFRQQHDAFRASVTGEPRGSEVVGFQDTSRKTVF
jgi:proline racemase